MFTALPATAAWSHRHARAGFEVSYFEPVEGSHRIEGASTAVEDGRTWFVAYDIAVDSAWRTRKARVTGRSAAGRRTVLLEADGAGHWQVDGEPASHLDGCLDVDLESSAMTNAFPVHRMLLPIGARAAAPAAYVRATDLSVERLEQEYLRAPDRGTGRCFDYAAPAFGFSCRLVYDASGLVLDYPGIASRMA
ncbi:putative glycolipid-binding domain-containing protein [Nocardia flavorosea]|uniref:Putative glycolipid-binding domain-containing protein n=1 Tax=Nocardia flavorosea TaxID=53429 RepID=A0A846YAT6_9NOCA|nr:putative glycolipid-binding domain-containing protein [Nocardia flavorosea]NKY55967.1 putative glycolipid-binding domain-containing protein [Nocardia flavorosea]